MRAAVLLLALCACLPNPQSVAERRETFDRASLLGTIIVTAPPPTLTGVHARFDGPIELVGYTLEPAVPARGDRVEVTLFWRAAGPLDEDFTVFVHGDAASGNARRIHGDHFPAGGDYPTDVWRPDEIVVDRFTIVIPRDYEPPRLSLFIGLYKGEARVALKERGLAPADNEDRSRAIDLELRPSRDLTPSPDRASPARP